MKQKIFSQLLCHIVLKGLTAVFALMLLSLLPLTSVHADGFGNDVHLCPADRPCITELYQQGNTIHIAWDPHESYDGYNVSWSRPGREDGFHVDGTSTTFTTPNHNMTYTFSVEGCNTHFLAPSTCSPLSNSEQITTK